MTKMREPHPGLPSQEGERGVFRMADRMAIAMAQGKLDEFLDRELPDNENARKLASLMMKMTGMEQEWTKPSGEARREAPDGAAPSGDPGISSPAEHLQAVGNDADEGCADEARASDGGSGPHGSGENPAAMIEELRMIASENDVTLDWIVQRAFRTYVHDYRRTGRL